MAKKKQTKNKEPKRKKTKASDAPKEKEKLQARIALLIDEVEDYWYGKRGKHSHVNPIFNEYWRIVEVAKDLHKGSYIFDELGISDVTQPNADDLQVLEMDLEKMLVCFEMDEKGSLERLFDRLTMD